MAIFGAGPIASLILAAVILALCLCIHIPEWSAAGIFQSSVAPGFFIAALSLTIGLFNLLPILPLDGGHLVLFALELVRGRPVGLASGQWLRVGGHSVLLVFSVLALVGLSLVFR